MSTDPRARLAALLPPDGVRQVLARIEAARRKGVAARIAAVEVDEHGVVHVDVRFSVEVGSQQA